MQATEQRRRVDFIARGIPKGEPRPRATIRGKHASVYSAKTADAWKYAVRSSLLDSLAIHDDWPLFTPELPVGLVVTFYMPRPQSHHVNSDRNRPLKDSAPIWHRGKPDTDNLIKAVMDALGPWPKGNQGLLWEDDQVVSVIECVKLYTEEGMEPGARITAMTLDPNLSIPAL